MYVMKCKWLGKLRKNTKVKNITVYFKLLWNTVTPYNTGINQGAVHSSWITVWYSTEYNRIAPWLWLQYVGDTFVVWPQGDMSYRSFNHLNGLSNTVKR
jgi:hypothetical protein